MPEHENCEAGTVLIIDDDRAVMMAFRGILERVGYRVLTADDGGEGTEIFQDQHDEIDLVIMDWRMPGLDGHHWIKPMLQIDPRANIIFCTAYELDEFALRELGSNVITMLKKPVSPEKLVDVVGKALASD